MRLQTHSSLARRAVAFAEVLRPVRSLDGGSNGHASGLQSNSGSVPPSIAVSRADYERLRARKLELEVSQKEAQLVDRDEVCKAVFETNRQVRRAILGVPDRIADLLAAETDRVVVYDTLSDELRRALVQLSDDIQRGHVSV